MTAKVRRATAFPTGCGTVAGEAWRTRVTYMTNLRTSYAAGRYRQLVESGIKFWMWKHSGLAKEPRAQHLAWDGLVLPADHPFWKRHFPPQIPPHWGCRCRVVGVDSPESARTLGGDPDKTLPKDWAQVDAKYKTQGPDWNYAPGATWHPNLDKYPYAIARDIVAANMADGVFDRWQAKIAAQVADELAKPEYAGLDKDATVKLLRERLVRGEEYPVAVMTADKAALLGVSTQTVKFSDYDAIKQAHSRMGDASFTVDAYRAVQGIMDDAELIVRESGQMTVWFRRDGRLMVGVVAQTQTGKGVYLKSLRFGSEADKRRSLAAGEEIFRK